MTNSTHFHQKSLCIFLFWICAHKSKFGVLNLAFLKHFCGQKVIADTANQPEFVIEMEIKLFVARKRIQLTVQAPLRSEDGEISGRTIQFKTTSSGGAMKYVILIEGNVILIKLLL